MTVRLLQLGLVLVVTFARTGVVRPAAAPTAPAFAVQFDGMSLHRYRHGPAVSDDLLDATVALTGEDEWELTLTPKHDPITAVWFPWEADRALVPRADSAVVYYPRLLGVAVRSALLAEWGWQGGPYPGECFAPLVVVADDSESRMVAATNWPPRRVTPMYSLGRIGLRYDERVTAGVRRSYRALVVRTSRGAGESPWQRALDRYKSWVKARVLAAGLEPSPPPWLQVAHGWLNVQLENLPTWDPGAVKASWERWRQWLPWVQFWGQMSGHFEHGRSDPSQAGCCLQTSQMHSRYEPDLLRIARGIAREGHVGFYARPRAPYAPLVAPGDSRETPEFAFVRDWLQRNRSEYGANAFYVDVLGGRDFGEPLRVAKLIKGEMDPATVIERAVDIYPSASLVSGALGGGTWQGGPGRTPGRLGQALSRTTFPAFGRYLLDDRIMFLGESNGDYRWWGPQGGYWTERQAFLLGAKFDVVHPTENGRPDGPANEALVAAIEARDQVGWWRRDPVYLDQRGIGAIPADVDVRRFRGRDGETLLVVDNWSGRRDVTLMLDGRSVALPNERLSIVVIPRAT